MARRLIKFLVQRFPFKTFLVLSFLLHLSMYSAVLIDWNLAAQWAGLKAEISKLMEKLEQTPEPEEKMAVVSEAVQEAVEDTVTAMMTGKKLRIGKEVPAWQEADLQEQQAAAAQKAEAELKAQQQSGSGNGPKDLEFEKPKKEVTDEVMVDLLKPADLPPEVLKTLEESQFAAEMAMMEQTEIVDKCPRDQAYGGIGVIYHPVPRGDNLMEVVKVGPNYPADAAGVQPGDLLFLDPKNPLKGQPNTKVTITYFHKGRKREVTVQRKLICVSQRLPPEPTAGPLNPGAQP